MKTKKSKGYKWTNDRIMNAKRLEVITKTSRSKKVLMEQEKLKEVNN
jgi:hypothetical protein